MRKQRFLQHDGTEKFFTSPRQEGTYLNFTSCGDDLQNNLIGEGQNLSIDNSDGNKNTERIIETSFLDNIFLKDGIVFWQNADFGDTITLDIVLPANTPYLAEDNNGNAEKKSDGSYEIITSSAVPDETWTGSYFLFNVDVTMFRFVNKFQLIGTNTYGLVLESSDTAEIPKELKFRFVLNTPSNSDVKVLINMEIYRENTV